MSNTRPASNAEVSLAAELSTQVVLRLVVEGDERRVEGVVSDGSDDRPFVGWMALLDALEGILEGRALDGDR